MTPSRDTHGECTMWRSVVPVAVILNHLFFKLTSGIDIFEYFMWNCPQELTDDWLGNGLVLSCNKLFPDPNSNVNPDFYWHMASLGHNELKPLLRKHRNIFAFIQNYYHFLSLKWCWHLKFFLGRDLFILHSQHHDWWWPGGFHVNPQH